MKEYLIKLNKNQYTAATSVDGRILILAGAGSGKTATLISRVAYMIDSGINPNEIMLLTFTNKAAQEMKNRAVKMIGELALSITACTFHSYCANFLRKYSGMVGIKNNFIILDSVDTSDAMKIAKQDFIDEQKKLGVEYDKKLFPSVKEILCVYETAINNCVKFKDVVADCISDCDYCDVVISVIRKFIDYKKSKDYVDYNDLLYYTKLILSENESVRHKFNSTYKYVSCDEYQDTNTIQNEILKLMTCESGNLAVVGDDNQSIYAFRCANIENILSFSMVYPDCKTIILDENYRSSQEILDVANTMMSYATEGIEKKLHGQFHGEKPHLTFLKNNSDEDEYIYQKINELHKNGINYNDIAVIVRSASQSFGLEILLNRNGIPYEKFGGVKFMEKNIVKDILSFLKLSVNEKDEIALFRILQLYSGIGNAYGKKISQYVNVNGIDKIDLLYKKTKFSDSLTELKQVIGSLKNDNVSSQLHYLIDCYYEDLQKRTIEMMATTDEKKRELAEKLTVDIEEVKALYDMSEGYKSTQKFLTDLTLDATKKNDDSNDKLNITTIHSAKGLEYDTVFIMDAIDGVFPKTIEGCVEDSEELRCMYVAVTRAKNKLFITAPKLYTQFGQYTTAILSHFIRKDDIIECMNIGNPSLKYSMCNQNQGYSDLF